jgi:hypothetical protein
MEDEKPDTRHLVLKPKVIVPTDSRSLPGDGTAISVQLIHRENRLAEENAKRKPGSGGAAASPLPAPALPPVFKVPVVNPLDPPPKPGDEEAIRVPEMLSENRAAEERSGWGRLKRFRGRKSKRNRDFLIFVGGLDLAIAAGIKFMPGTVTMIYGIAAITLVTSMFGWIMFVVNDDY